MAFDRYFPQKWKPIPTAADETERASPNFDCNLCLDFAQDPVVTLCGHLYCWPCIYKWLHFQSGSLSSDELPWCPVCKTEVSDKMLIPLYGRGASLSDVKHRDKNIPPRPPACSSIQGLTNMPNLDQRHMSHDLHQNPHDLPSHYASYEGSNSSLLFGEMVYARVFGNSQSLYSYPNSYHLAGSRTPRLRQQELQTDKSLYRVSIFLSCCFLLCLLLF